MIDHTRVVGGLMVLAMRPLNAGIWPDARWRRRFPVPHNGEERDQGCPHDNGGDDPPHVGAYPIPPDALGRRRWLMLTVERHLRWFHLPPAHPWKGPFCNKREYRRQGDLHRSPFLRATTAAKVLHRRVRGEEKVEPTASFPRTTTNQI